MHVLDREDRGWWFEWGVKESIYLKLEQPSLNRGGGLRHQLSATYNAVLKSLPRKLNHSLHLSSWDTSDSHDDQGKWWQPKWFVGGSVTHRLEAGRCSLRPLPWVGMILHKGENPYQKPFRWWAKETRRSSVAFNLNTVITLTETDITDITLKQTSQT